MSCSGFAVCRLLKIFSDFREAVNGGCEGFVGVKVIRKAANGL